MVDGKQSSHGVYDVLRQEYASKLQSSKRRDRFLTAVLSILLGSVLNAFLAPFTWAIFRHGLGFRFTDESVLGHYGLLGFEWRGAILPVFILSALLYVPLYRALRAYRRRQLWSG